MLHRSLLWGCHHQPLLLPTAGALSHSVLLEGKSQAGAPQYPGEPAQLSNELRVLTGTAEGCGWHLPWVTTGSPPAWPSPGQQHRGRGLCAQHSTKVSGMAVPLTQPPEPLGNMGQRPTLPPTQPSLRDPGQPPATLRDGAGPAPKHLE